MDDVDDVDGVRACCRDELPETGDDDGSLEDEVGSEKANVDIALFDEAVGVMEVWDCTVWDEKSIEE